MGGDYLVVTCGGVFTLMLEALVIGRRLGRIRRLARKPYGFFPSWPPLTPFPFTPSFPLLFLCTGEEEKGG